MPRIPDIATGGPRWPGEAFGIGNIHTATDGRDILWNDPDGWEIDQPWLWWDGDAASNPMGGQTFGNPPPGAEFSGSLHGWALPIVSRCLQLTADKIASMPWKTYQGRQRTETPAWITDPQALARDGRRAFIGSMHARLSGVEFWSTYLRSMILYGEGIAYTPRMRDEDGEPTGPIVAPLYILHPKQLEIIDGRWFVPDPEGNPEYQEFPGWEPIDARELIVTRWAMRPGHKRGLGALAAHAYDLGAASRVRSYADNLVQRGVPNGYLKSTKPDLTQIQADQLKKDWMSRHGGTRKSIAVLNATTEFHKLTIDPQAMQYAEMKRLSMWDIALIFGVPPAKLGLPTGGSLTYSTLEQANAEYVQDSLMGLARKVEAAIDAALPVGTDMKVDFNQLLRADTSARYAAYQVGLDAGFLTVEEVRALEDLPPLTEQQRTQLRPLAAITAPAPDQQGVSA
jgi:HK97 family phage portal protein